MSIELSITDYVTLFSSFSLKATLYGTKIAVYISNTIVTRFQKILNRESGIITIFFRQSIHEPSYPIEG